MAVGTLPWLAFRETRISRLKRARARFLRPLPRLTILGCGFVLLTTGLSYGQILQNGSFENDYTDWTATGNQVIATSDPSHPASDGSKVVVFSLADDFPDAMLSQTFATTPGQRYGLALDLGTVGAQADQRLGVTITGNDLLRDQILTVAGLDADPFYVPQHITFVADSPSTTLTFQDASITYYVIDLLLDNIQITPEDAEAPLITSPPERFATATGQSATFSVAAVGPGTLSYQWRFDGDPIDGATDSSYTIAAVDPSHAGNYDVVVSNAVGSVTSSAATLTVLPPGILLNGSFEHGSAAWTFTGTVATSTNVNYGVTDGTQLTHFNFGQRPADGFLSQSFSTTPNQTYVLTFDAGAFSLVNQDEQRMEVIVQGNNTLISPIVSVFAPGNGTTYVAQNFVFTADSDITTLTFHDISLTTANVDLLLDNVQVTLEQNGPTITSDPQSLTVQEGGSASFSVTATGQAALQYQWRFNQTDIPGATSDTYTIDPVQQSDAGNYEVVVSDASASPPVTSETAVLSVVPVGNFTNGSFEFDYAGWSASGNQNIVSPPDFPATDGVKAVAFNVEPSTPNGVLSQTFTTTAGQTYVLDFDMGTSSFESFDEQRMQMTVQGNNTLLSESISLFAQGTGTQYVSQSFTFVADSATTTLTFQDISPATLNLDLLLDNVRIVVPPTLQLTAASSRKTHDSAGDFDIPLSLDGEPGVECRGLSGDHTFVFTFTNNVVSGSASVTSGVGGVSGSPIFAGNTMTVNLTGVANEQQITVTLSNVTDSFSQVLPPTAVSVNLLLGDTNSDKRVNIGDTNDTRSQSGQVTDDGNLRNDVNLDGRINVGDTNFVRANSGAFIP